MNGNDLSATAATLICGLIGAGIVMGLTLVWALRIKRLCVFDISWGLGFFVIAAVSLLAASGDADPTVRWLFPILTACWGLRLSAHIALRNPKLIEDPRYAAMVERSPHSFAGVATRQAFVPQAAGLWLVALPIMIGVDNDHLPTCLAVAGVAVWALGLFFEAVGDWQLGAFRADPSNAGQVMNRGLWRYTRHPNYFGDACVWWGIWLLAASSWPGVATVVSPLAMTYFLAAKTGKPLLEKSMTKTKPGYADYVARTSGFIPLPPRRSRSTS